jgi:hypothetical protein
MAKKLIGHYVVKVFIGDDLTETQLKDARCNFCGMHADIEELFDDRAEYEVDIEVTNQMPWNGVCECVR